MTLMTFMLLPFIIRAEIFDNLLLRNEQSNSYGSFEAILEKEYQLLKNQPNANETKMLMQQLHKNEKKIEEELISEEGTELPDTSKEEKRDHIQPMGETIVAINERSNVSMALFQADMLLTKEQVEEILEGIEGDERERIKRQAYYSKRYPETIWENGEVPYFYYPNATENIKRVFEKASRVWEKYTCVKFFKNRTAPDRIGVMKGFGCFSNVGRTGGVQTLSLGPGCESVGTAAHEIGHALGFFHTHSRYDRSSFVKILAKNIIRELMPDFARHSNRTNYNYNLTYDYGSVMHYGQRAFTKNGYPTIKSRDPEYSQTLGSSIVSFYDKLMMNLHYGCLNKCDEKSSAKCYNGGYPNPNNCFKCICPSGYGGTLCSKRPKGCGRILMANSTFQTLIDKLDGNDVNSTEDDFITCNYWIVGPIGSKIEVQLYAFTPGFARDGCTIAGIEIKTGNDKRRTGYRFCYGWSETILVSTNHIVPVISYTTPGVPRTAVLRYRIKIE